jgi:hypothetical protein
MSVGFWHACHYHTISVNDCQSALNASELAYLIRGIQEIDEFRYGIYANGKNVPGFYATAQSTRTFDGSQDHWYMIGYSPERNFAQVLRQKRCLTAEEEDLLAYLESRANRSRLCA